jgi:hypothetical protein
MTSALCSAPEECAIVHGNLIAAALPCTGSDTINIHIMKSRMNGRIELI